MSRLHQLPKIETSVLIELRENEMRALDALAGYGIDPFLEVFYKHLGKHYMQPHEAGLRSLFATVREDLPPVLKRATAARTAFALRNPVIRSQEEHDALLNRISEQAVAKASTEQASHG